jgi:hypothetical protein
MPIVSSDLTVIIIEILHKYVDTTDGKHVCFCNKVAFWCFQVGYTCLGCLSPNEVMC